MGVFRSSQAGKGGSQKWWKSAFRRGKSKSSEKHKGKRGRTDETFFASILNWLPWNIRLAILIPFYVSCIAAVAGMVLMIYYTLTFPDLLGLQNSGRAPVIRIIGRDGSVLATRGTAHAYVPIDLVPERVRNAVIAIEDRRFFSHWGVDPMGMLRAGMANLRAGRFAQGGSTITQQLAKNLFLTPERTMTRKLEELALAFWLELRFTKAQIFELYLNRVYFGSGAYGVEAAAQRYFAKSIRALTDAEAALIAGLLKAPSKYSPYNNPGKARLRGRTVLRKMYSAGLITTERLREALRQNIRFTRRHSNRAHTALGVEYAVDYILERMPPLIEGGNAEIIVETTLDPKLQQHANNIVSDKLRASGKRRRVSQAAAIVLDSEGGIRALVGGRDYRRSQFNRAVLAKRQPGSAFMPFTVLAALERGAIPDTASYNLPANIDGWAPKNGAGKLSGALSMRDALANSVNTVATRLGMDAGPSEVAAIARRFGIASNLRADASLALGASKVSLLELTGAYASIAAGGERVDPFIVRRIRMSSGRILYARAISSTKRIMSVTHIGALSDMLVTAVNKGTGRNARIPRHTVAGKTGTTPDARDAWFMGYTAHMTAGVWVGNDNAAAMDGVNGGNLPAVIWRDVMANAHREMTPLPLLGTAGISGRKSPPGLVSNQRRRAVSSPSSLTASDRVPLTATTPGRLVVAPPANSKAGFTQKSSDQIRARWLSKRAIERRRQATGQHAPIKPSQQRNLAAPKKAIETTRQRSHPKRGISADFIARALAATPRDVGTANPGTRPNNAGRLDGMMSLGKRGQIAR